MYVQVPILSGVMKFIYLMFSPWPQMRYTKVCENEGMNAILNTTRSNYFERNILICFSARHYKRSGYFIKMLKIGVML